MPLILDSTSRSDTRSGTGDALDRLGIEGHRHELRTEEYGDSLAKIFLVFNCTSSSASWGNKTRLDKKKNVLYIDIMLDHEQMVNQSRRGRMVHILESLQREVPAVLTRLNSVDFNTEGVILAFMEWLETLRPRLEGPLPEMRASFGEEQELMSEIMDSIPVEFSLDTDGPVTSLAMIGGVVRSLSLHERKCFPRPRYGLKTRSAELPPLAMILVLVHCDRVLPETYDLFKESHILTVHVVVDTTKMIKVSEIERQEIFLLDVENALVASLMAHKIASFDRDRFISDIRAWIRSTRPGSDGLVT